MLITEYGKFEKYSDMPDWIREKYQIHIIQIDLCGPRKWKKKNVWLNAPPRAPENNWNYDKLGRPFSLGQVLLWFTTGKDGKPVQHLSYIATHHVDTTNYFAYQLKSGVYIQPWEKKLTRTGDLYIINSCVEVSRLRQDYGVIIVDSLCNPDYYDPNGNNPFAHL